jgi:hypothetical protein
MPFLLIASSTEDKWWHGGGILPLWLDHQLNMKDGKDLII